LFAGSANATTPRPVITNVHHSPHRQRRTAHRELLDRTLIFDVLNGFGIRISFLASGLVHQNAFASSIGAQIAGHKQLRQLMKGLYKCRVD
jgi:aspartyl/asparaginyl beta-hydroxylase (cupin superfamily)